MNRWINTETGKRTTSADRPEGYGWEPVWNPRRVTGATWEPYRRGTEWAVAANAAMCRQAAANFMRDR